MPAKTTTTPAPIFTEVTDFISRYIVADEAKIAVVAAWYFHTHQWSPMCPEPVNTCYLYVNGPKGSGKTLLGRDIASLLCRNYQATVGITGPGLFRIVEATERGTLGIDEVDALYNGAKDETLRMMLNDGYRRGGAVPRVVGGKMELFSCYCPKLLMGIDNGHLPETVEDRSLRINLKRATADEMNAVEEFYGFEVEDEAADLNARMAAFVVEHGVAMREYRPTKIEGLTPRQWEVARSLVVVGHALGCEDLIRESIVAIFKANKAQTESVDSRILRTMRDLFTARGPKVTTNDVLAALSGEGIDLNGKGLGAKLNPLGINAGTIRIPGGTAKGYKLVDCQDAFTRYIAD